MNIKRAIVLIFSVRIGLSGMGCSSGHAEGEHCSWDSSYGCAGNCDDGLVCDNISSTCLPSDYYDQKPATPVDSGSGTGHFEPGEPVDAAAEPGHDEDGSADADADDADADDDDAAASVDAADE